MFSPFLVAVAFSFPQADDPVSRMMRYLEGTKHYKTTYTVTDGKNNKFADCTWEVLQPESQRLTGSGKGYDYEFIQTHDATVFFANHVKTYLEWPAFGRLIPAPPNTQLLAVVYPSVVSDPRAAKRFKWSAPKKVAIGGKMVDELVAEEKSQAGTVNVRLAIDEVGRVARFYIKSVGQMGITEYTFDFQSHERLTTTKVDFNGKLKEGYVPFHVLPPYAPIMPSEEAPDTRTIEASTGKPVTLALKDKVSVMVFTAPDCDVSKSMQKALAKAEAKYGKEASFVEVSLGTEKPVMQGREGSRPLYWDKDGSIEKSWGINYTPYVLIVGKDGAIVRGFGGFGPDQEESFLKVIGAGINSGKG